MLTDDSAWEAALTARDIRTDARFKLMEGTLKELQAQGANTLQWMQQAGQRLDQSEAQTQALHHEVQQVRQDMVQSQASMQAALQSTLTTIKADLSADISQQLTSHFGSITETLAKKARTD